MIETTDNFVWLKGTENVQKDVSEERVVGHKPERAEGQWLIFVAKAIKVVPPLSKTWWKGQLKFGSWWMGIRLFLAVSRGLWQEVFLLRKHIVVIVI